MLRSIVVDDMDIFHCEGLVNSVLKQIALLRIELLTHTGMDAVGID